MQDKLFSRSEGSTLNSLRRRIDRFCVLHPNFGIPNLMLYIVIGNIAFYLLSLFSTLDGGSFYSILSFSWAGLKQGQLWRLLSFSFLPTDTRPFWLLVSCYFYYWIGSTLEREWGTAKFTIYYLSGVLLTALGAVAACDAVERVCGVRPQIKWTNDLVLNGKKLKKAKLTMTRANQIWTGTFDADQFAFGSFKTPEPEEMNADEVFAERVLNLSIFRAGIIAYFKKFSEAMTGMDFPQFEKEIRAWAQERDAV